MRMMVRFKIPVDTGNEIVRSGKIGTVFEQLMADLKPEAAYMFPDDGDRAGFIVFDMQDETWVAGVVERFCFGVGAKVSLTPVMTPPDLQKALEAVPQIVQKYG